MGGRYLFVRVLGIYGEYVCEAYGLHSVDKLSSWSSLIMSCENVHVSFKRSEFSFVLFCFAFVDKIKGLGRRPHAELAATESVHHRVFLFWESLCGRLLRACEFLIPGLADPFCPLWVPSVRSFFH